MKDTLYLRFLFGIYTRYKYLMTKQPEKGQTLCIWIPMLQIRLEILRNPNLQNTPVVLLNPKKINRRTVWQCSKEALEMGIYLNQPVSQAFSFCQNLATKRFVVSVVAPPSAATSAWDANAKAAKSPAEVPAHA